ncbi:hypothetical protein J6590_041274 [Homalodisca vitripennis]|nr:hypothetical protein J6590_041274 [Homalodisca vitripennis]
MRAFVRGPHLRYLGQPSMYAALYTLKRGDNTRQMRAFGPHLRYLGQFSMYAELSTLKRGENTRQMRAFVRVRTSVTWDSPQCMLPSPLSREAITRDR